MVSKSLCRGMFLFAVALVVLTLALVAVSLHKSEKVLADPNQPRSSVDSNAKLQQAEDLMSGGFYSAATRLLQEIIRDNAGTQLAAKAKLGLATIQMDGFLNLDEALRICEEVASEFRDTPVGLGAESDAIGLTLDKDNNLSRYQERSDSLIVKIGGIPLRAVMRAREESPTGSSGISFTPVPFLTTEEQEDMLFKFYSIVAFDTEGTGRSSRAVDREAVSDGLKLLRRFVLSAHANVKVGELTAEEGELRIRFEQIGITFFSLGERSEIQIPVRQLLERHWIRRIKFGGPIQRLDGALFDGFVAEVLHLAEARVQFGQFDEEPGIDRRLLRRLVQHAQRLVGLVDLKIDLRQVLVSRQRMRKLFDGDAIGADGQISFAGLPISESEPAVERSGRRGRRRGLEEDFDGFVGLARTKATSRRFNDHRLMRRIGERGLYVFIERLVRLAAQVECKSGGVVRNGLDGQLGFRLQLGLGGDSISGRGQSGLPGCARRRRAGRGRAPSRNQAAHGGQTKPA